MISLEISPLDVIKEDMDAGHAWYEILYNGNMDQGSDWRVTAY